MTTGWRQSSKSPPVTRSLPWIWGAWMVPSLPNSQLSYPHVAKCWPNNNLHWYWRCSLDSVITYAGYHITLKTICTWGKTDLLCRCGNRLRKVRMPHPRSHSCCLGFAIVQAALWLAHGCSTHWWALYFSKWFHMAFQGPSSANSWHMSCP